MESQLNPKIQKMMVGTREQKEIKIYPLSFADVTEMTDLILETLSTYFSQNVQDDKVLVTLVLDILKKNLNLILTKVTDEGITGKDFSLEQLSELADVIYEQNYKVVRKNFISLLQKIQNKDL